MQNPHEKRKHARGSYLSPDELQEEQKNISRESRSGSKLPEVTSSMQENGKVTSTISVPNAQIGESAGDILIQQKTDSVQE